jgi:hypothetical protein
VIAHLEERGLIAFKGQPQRQEVRGDRTYWDSETYPDFRGFVAVAQAAGVKVVTICSGVFHTEEFDEALEQLASSSLDRETRRSIERRLRDLGKYEGFVCEIELSFVEGGRTYYFAQATPWYEEALDLLDQIEDSFEPPDENPLGGGYYSNN